MYIYTQVLVVLAISLYITRICVRESKNRAKVTKFLHTENQQVTKFLHFNVFFLTIYLVSPKKSSTFALEIKTNKQSKTIKSWQI